VEKPSEKYGAFPCSFRRQGSMLSWRTLDSTSHQSRRTIVERLIIRSWMQILDDEGSIGTSTARAFLQRTATKFRHWPLELDFHFQRRRIPLCLSVTAWAMASLLMVDLHPTSGPEIRYGNQISTSISFRIPIHLDGDGCPI